MRRSWAPSPAQLGVDARSPSRELRVPRGERADLPAVHLPPRPFPRGLSATAGLEIQEHGQRASRTPTLCRRVWLRRDIRDPRPRRQAQNAGHARGVLVPPLRRVRGSQYPNHHSTRPTCSTAAFGSLRELPNGIRDGALLCSSLLSYSDVFDRYRCRTIEPSATAAAASIASCRMIRTISAIPRPTSSSTPPRTTQPPCNHDPPEEGVDQVCFGVEVPGSGRFPRRKWRPG